MAEQRKKRRDTTANLALVTPAIGVLGIDTTRKAPIVGDAATAGGIPIPSFGEIINGDWIFGTAVSDNSPDDGDNITLTIDSRYSSFTDGGSVKAGAKFRFIAPAANTGASILTINWTGGTDAATIKKYSGGAQADLAASDFIAGQIVEVIFDGTVFQIAGGLGGSAGGVHTEIERQTAAGVTSLTFTTGLAGYDQLKLIGTDISVDTNVRDLEVVVSDDGGSTYETASYDGSLAQLSSGAWTYKTGATDAITLNKTSIQLQSSEIDNMFNFELTCWAMDAAHKKNFTFIFAHNSPASAASENSGFGSYTFKGNNNALDALKVQLNSSGNFSGNFKLIGLNQ